MEQAAASVPTRRREPFVPRPGIVLSLPGWTSAHEGNRRSGCPVCGGAALAVDVVCLGCLASGVDRWLPPVEPHERPKPARVDVAGNGKPLAGGTSRGRGNVWRDWLPAAR